MGTRHTYFLSQTREHVGCHANTALDAPVPDQY
jgi:hypothetical protein